MTKDWWFKPWISRFQFIVVTIIVAILRELFLE